MSVEKEVQHHGRTRDAEDVFKYEAEQMNDYAEQTKEINELIRSYKDKAENSHKVLNEELEKLNKERVVHEQSLKEFEKFHSLQLTKAGQYKNDYTLKKKKRVAIAEKIDMKSLLGLQLEDRKSEAHEVFRWILAVMYKEPVGKYYWDNFKTQAFKEDKGVDFKERMGKMSSADLKEDQRVTTQKLLSHKEAIINHHDFGNDAREQIRNIFEIAELILDGADIAKKTKQLEQEDLKVRDQKITKEEIFKKTDSKCQAVKERLTLTQKYLTLLNEIQKTMLGKAKQYEGGKREGEVILRELRKVKEGKQGASGYLEGDKKEGCLLF